MKKSKYIIGMILSVSLFIVTLTACASKETGEEAKEVESVMEEETVVVEEATVEEAEPEPTPEAVAEPTVVETVEEATEETPVYEGIDMESTLPGAEWIQTFVGIIEEPKVVIFSDETGKKQIVEDGDRVNFNPDVDCMALYLPEGAKVVQKTKGISFEETANNNGCGMICKLDVEKTRERGRISAALYAEFDGKEIELPFDFKPE